MERKESSKDDKRLKEDFNWEGYFQNLKVTLNDEILKKDQEEKFGDSFIQINGHKIPLNFKNYVKYQTKLTLSEKNTMINLHNTGSKDEEYGKRLYKYSQKLIKAGKLDDGEEQRII